MKLQILWLYGLVPRLSLCLNRKAGEGLGTGLVTITSVPGHNQPQETRPGKVCWFIPSCPSSFLGHLNALLVGISLSPQNHNRLEKDYSITLVVLLVVDVDTHYSFVAFPVSDNIFPFSNKWLKHVFAYTRLQRQTFSLVFRPCPAFNLRTAWEQAQQWTTFISSWACSIVANLSLALEVRWEDLFRYRIELCKTVYSSKVDLRTLPERWLSNFLSTKKKRCRAEWVTQLQPQFRNTYFVCAILPTTISSHTHSQKLCPVCQSIEVIFGSLSYGKKYVVPEATSLSDCSNHSSRLPVWDVHKHVSFQHAVNNNQLNVEQLSAYLTRCFKTHFTICSCDCKSSPHREQ